jgi:hypothetical protein
MATYACSGTICYGVGAAADSAVREFQKLLNEFGGSAGFAPINPDGKLGDATVAAFQKVAAWLARQGYGEVASLGGSTKESLAAAVTGSSSGAIFGAVNVGLDLGPKPATASSGSGARSGGGGLAPAPASYAPVTVPWHERYGYTIAAGVLGLAALLVVKRQFDDLAVGPRAALAGARRRRRRA